MFCPHSTDESIQNEQISILAIFEIFISIAIYWGIASYFNYYYHIYFSLAIAPLFLLRTKKSEEEALKFLAYFINSEEKSFAKYLLISFVLLCVVMLIVFITYNTVSFLVTNYQGFDLLWRMFIFGVGTGGIASVMMALGTMVTIGQRKVVAEAVVIGVALLMMVTLIGGAIIVAGGGAIGVGIITIAGVAGARGIGFMAIRGVGVISGAIVGVISGGGALMFIFVISLIKMFFTLKNIFDGLKKIPYNWNKLIVHQDIYSQAEIIPGINKFNGMNHFKFMHLKNNLIDSKQVIKNRIINALLLVMLYIPTIFYRISLKSTSLFYWILFINPFRINKKYNNKRMKEIITKEQGIYLLFPVIMLSVLLSINVGFGSIDSIIEYIKETFFYSSVKYFLTYFIISSIISWLMWFIAKMFLIGDEDSSEGFYRMLLNGLLKILKFSMGVSAILYVHYIYKLLNV